jgi:1,5-anhydro-D-fructose reductase (1,5-anhydro-D-mannitol-forming)
MVALLMKEAKMTTRWGILGCGDVCEVKSGPGFGRARGSALVAVMRRDGEKAADFARRHGVPRWYDDAEKLIRDPQVDAVYVATPVSTHMSFALQVCEAGKPCYVEKPMARSAAECRRMVEAFEAAGVPLFVAYYRRGLPRFLKVKELIDAGSLGRVASVCYRYGEPRHRRVNPSSLPWRLRAEHSGGGLFMDLGSHTLDVLDFLLGPLKQVAGVAGNAASDYAVEDAVAMSFQTSGGALGTAIWNFASDATEDWIEISGTDGRVRLSTFGSEPVRFVHGDVVEEFDLPNPMHVHQPLIQGIVDTLQGRGQCPSTGRSGLRTALVMDQVLAGYYGGRDDAFWEREGSWPGQRTRT